MRWGEWGLVVQVVFWVLYSLYWQRRAYLAERDVVAWKRQVFKSIEDVTHACFSSMTACEAIKAAMEGRRVYAAKAAEGMTLLEAQQFLDEVLGPYYPPKGRA